jgi:hypothetical protein
MFDVNTLFGDCAGENLWLDLNQDTLPRVYFRDLRQQQRHGLIR